MTAQTKQLFFGLDPGQMGGGIGWICADRYGFESMPKSTEPVTDVGRLLAIFRGIIETTRPDWIGTTVELVNARPGEAVSWVFNFGRNLGRLETIAQALDWVVDAHSLAIWPARWQKPFGLYGGHADEWAKKLAHRQLAQQFFPDVTVDDHGADALLIAAYGATQFNGCGIDDVVIWFEGNRKSG